MYVSSVLGRTLHLIDGAEATMTTYMMCCYANEQMPHILHCYSFLASRVLNGRGRGVPCAKMSVGRFECWNGV